MRIKSHYRCSRCALLTPEVFPREGQLLCVPCMGKAVLHEVNNFPEPAAAQEELAPTATILTLRPR